MPPIGHVLYVAGWMSQCGQWSFPHRRPRSGQSGIQRKDRIFIQRADLLAGSDWLLTISAFGLTQAMQFIRGLIDSTRTMHLNELRERVKRLIADGRTEDAIGVLLEYIDSFDAQSEKDIILNSARLNRELRSIRIGVENRDTPSNLTKINSSIIEIVENLELDEHTDKIITSPRQNRSLKWIAIGAILLTTACLVAYIVNREKSVAETAGSGSEGQPTSVFGLDNFVVRDKTTILDLRTIRYVHPDSIEVPKSFADLYHIINLKNLHGRLNTLRLPYKTGGADLEVKSITHDSKLYESSDLDNDLRGRFKIEKVLEINLGKGVGDDICVINEAKYWNAFCQFPRYGLIANYQAAPQEMTLIVQFPEGVPFPNYQVYEFAGGNRVISHQHQAFRDTDKNTLKITIKIEEAFVRDSYLIEWDYMPQAGGGGSRE